MPSGPRPDAGREKEAMPLFGGKQRPKLDGLTKEEGLLRDALNPEVLLRAGEKGVAGQAPAAAAVLREKMEAEPAVFLWPCLLGWQMISARRYDQAVAAFLEAIDRDPTEVRGHFGAGHAYFEAAESKRIAEGSAPLSGPVAEMTVDNLYNESLRSFKRALDLTSEKSERDRLTSSISSVEKALAKKAGRL